MNNKNEEVIINGFKIIQNYSSLYTKIFREVKLVIEINKKYVLRARLHFNLSSNCLRSYNFCLILIEPSTSVKYIYFSKHYNYKKSKWDEINTIWKITGEKFLVSREIIHGFDKLHYLSAIIQDCLTFYPTLGGQVICFFHWHPLSRRGSVSNVSSYSLKI